MRWNLILACLLSSSHPSLLLLLLLLLLNIVAVLLHSLVAKRASFLFLERPFLVVVFDQLLLVYKSIDLLSMQLL